MERIQSAIEKARAERRDVLARGTAAPLPGTPSAGGPDDIPPTPLLVPDPTSGALFDPAVDVAARAARWDALPTFVPDARQLDRNRIVAAAGGRDAVPFDVMRTRLLQQMRANKWRRVAITSPTAACGKSTIALNLAFGLARQPDIRTILCELDLRRPTLSATLGLRDPLHFARVIEGVSPFADQARRIGTNLAVSLNRGAVKNPAELLHGPAVATALDRIEAEYDPTVMIFDMPPLLVSDDAMAFLGQVDCAILVAAAESTTIKQIDACERELAAQTNVLGIVLNKCRYVGPDYGYDYY